MTQAHPVEKIHGANKQKVKLAHKKKRHPKYEPLTLDLTDSDLPATPLCFLHT